MKLMEKFKRAPRRVDTCVESACRGQMRHGSCVVCGAWTDGSTIGVEEETLRRRKMYLCTRCLVTSDSFRERQNQLREMRTKRDWEQVTDPVAHDVLSVSMPEQYTSKARATVRAFAASDFEFAAANNSDSATLRSSINALGLSNEIYVEVRDGETILRRVVK